jgi:RNA polymerase sigma-70 factor (ECF subfamily)
VPDNPRAWLRRVAGNAAIDRVRRDAREFGVDENWEFGQIDPDVVTPSLSDPELDLMVLCCDPAIAPQDQLFLALKTVCGYTAAETAALFFIQEDALSQRLSRAKRTLKTQSGELARFPTRFALKARLPQLLKVIYLMFAWGYLPRRGDVLFREDICREAVRLSEGLMSQTQGSANGHHALHALLLFKMARLPARRSDRRAAHPGRAGPDAMGPGNDLRRLSTPAGCAGEPGDYTLSSGSGNCFAACSDNDVDRHAVDRDRAIL